jgi:hypothetical protein
MTDNADFLWNDFELFADFFSAFMKGCLATFTTRGTEFVQINFTLKRFR